MIRKFLVVVYFLGVGAMFAACFLAFFGMQSFDLFLFGYLLVGLVLAQHVCPLSFPFGRNALMVTFLWPWPVAAQAVKMATGKYPKWTPPL